MAQPKSERWKLPASTSCFLPDVSAAVGFSVCSSAMRVLRSLAPICEVKNFAGTLLLEHIGCFRLLLELGKCLSADLSCLCQIPRHLKAKLGATGPTAMKLSRPLQKPTPSRGMKLDVGGGWPEFVALSLWQCFASAPFAPFAYILGQGALHRSKLCSGIAMKLKRST